jgi:hypothetical protein
MTSQASSASASHSATTIAASAAVWRIDARQHMLPALLEFACAAAAIGRRILISNCGQLPPAELERVVAAGEGHVECVPDAGGLAPVRLRYA